MIWGIVAVVVMLALVGATRLLRRLAGAFGLAATGLLLLHMQTAPGEALAALAAMAGGFALARPVRRMVTGGLL